MIHARRILVIIASVRARRVGPAIARWVAKIGQTDGLGAVEIVDLRDWRLPMDDEPGIPAAHPYDRDHTRAWSAKIASGDAIVFVTPQYNWGYPASLKNAIDHLYKEWRGKPALIVSYGSRGGGKCAAQLRQVLEGLDMRVARAMPGLILPRARIEANDGALDPAAEFARQAQEVRAAFGELAALLSA